MKKFIISLLVASAALVGVGNATSAQYGIPVEPVEVDSGGQVPAAGPAAGTPSAGLPATGSDGIGTTTGIAFGLLAVGLGIFLVTRVRRGHPNVA